MESGVNTYIPFASICAKLDLKIHYPPFYPRKVQDSRDVNTELVNDFKPFQPSVTFHTETDLVHKRMTK